MTALQRGLAVIEAFSGDRPELTLSEVAAITELNPATARRALMTLQSLGYVGQNGRRFVLKPRVLSLGAAFLSSVGSAAALEPVLRDFVESTGGSSSITVLDGSDILYIAHASQRRVMRMAVGVGYRYPAYPTSMGRVLLAGLTNPEIDDHLARAPVKKLTESTVTDRRKLKKLIVEARSDAYAVVSDELDYGLIALAVPLRAPSGRVVASVNASDSSRNYDAKKLVAERLRPLRESAATLEDILRRFPALIDSVSS